MGLEQSLINDSIPKETAVCKVVVLFSMPKLLLFDNGDADPVRTGK